MIEEKHHTGVEKCFDAAVRKLHWKVNPAPPWCLESRQSIYSCGRPRAIEVARRNVKRSWLRSGKLDSTLGAFLLCGFESARAHGRSSENGTL